MRSHLRSAVFGIALSFAALAAAQTAAPPSVAPAAMPLFVAEIRIGPKWDAAKPPQEQLYFKEHSANLRRLREAGHLVMGARYADKGLVVLAAASAADAHAMLEPDLSFKNEVFVYELHPFNVFYAGSVQVRPPPTPMPR
jgi:hypothetical protein